LLLTLVFNLGYIIKFFGISAFVSPWLPWLYNKEEYPLTELCASRMSAEIWGSTYEKLVYRKGGAIWQRKSLRLTLHQGLNRRTGYSAAASAAIKLK